MRPSIRTAGPHDAVELEVLDRGVGVAALPAEWASWADEPHRVLVCEVEGRVVGAIHLSLVGPGEGWVEGARVLPEFRGRGYARVLVEEAIRICAGYGARVVRCACPTHLSEAAFFEHLGFREVVRYEVWRADLEPATPPTDVRAVEPRALKDLSPWIRQEMARRSRELLPLGWRFRILRDEMLRAAVRERRLWADGAVLFQRAGPDRVVNLLVGDPEPLLGAVRADLPGPGVVAVFLAEGSPESPRLGTQGFRPHPWCPHGLRVLERVDDCC